MQLLSDSALQRFFRRIGTISFIEKAMTNKILEPPTFFISLLELIYSEFFEDGY